MRYQLVALIIFFFSYVQAQVRSLEFVIVDKITNLPIQDAHVFIGNATFGSITDDGGKCHFDIPEDVTKELIVSHISYDLVVLQYSKYITLEDFDTIFLNPNGIDFNEVVIEGKRAKQWKKNYRKFSNAFIGKGKRASLCEIKNPEVLRFANEDGVFKATAIDILKIKNHYLGYDVDFLLKELTIEKDGSMKYFGYPKFTDRSLTTNSIEIEENRKEAYEKSISHFLLNLVADNLTEAKYKIRLKRYTGSEFKDVSSPLIADLVFLDSLSGLHDIIYKDYLEVKHLGIREPIDNSFGMALGGVESGVFGSNYQGAGTRIGNPISMLYKSSPSLIVDKYGQILNQKKVQEYGYWAEQRISDLLPFDYGFALEYNSSKPLSKNEVERIPVIELDTTSVTVTHTLLYGDKDARSQILDYLDQNWKESYIPLLLDINKMITSEDINPKIIELLANKAEFYDYYSGLQWMWSGEPVFDEFYSDNKAEIYQHTDPLFQSFFLGQQETAEISIDEIVWGGVKHNSIPPLRRPKMIDASTAEYLDGDDIVFGIVINGEAKAYPKRILAWHEFFIDKIGEKNVAGVYCTLCGTMIAYDMNHRNDIHDLSTSGFLYRSNKLMYDNKTKSLWSTIDGAPVLGPLAGKGIKLKSYPVVTTKWKNWKENHPYTQVLDIETGYDRDYAEGAAYKSYFSHDGLMFPVPLNDNRLDNKAEVLIIRSSRYWTDPLAVSIKYLKKKKIHHDVVADKNVLVIAGKDGMSRVYYSKRVKFKSYKKGVLIDVKGKEWTVTDEYLLSDKGRKLLRTPAHNSFWFAWYNVYPETRLVK
ncbi:MAG: hypothetical protein ACJA1A_001783 [Saprospiraceae bacterium]|jgi:hypothetical protein